ncbi:MAG: hypothetical protein JW755_05670 [Candidatus Aminicenantes bacterium]|nr:hypothetical protein [Candidatus Aminicenantes bacterium]
MKKTAGYTALLVFCGFLFSFRGNISASINPDLKFTVQYTADAYEGSLTGRVYVMLSRRGEREPRFQVRQATGIPFWGQNVSGLLPGQEAVINHSSYGFPLESIRDIPPGDYYVQGFINIYTKFERADGHTLWLHQDRWEGQNWLRSPGNLFSEVKKVSIDPAHPQVISLVCDQVIPPVDIPPDTKWVKRIKFQSKLLTDFWGQPMYIGATVLLPKGYQENPEEYYPVNYIQGHFSLRAPYGFREEEPEEKDRWGRRGYEFYQFWNSDECPRFLAVTFQHPCPYYDDSHAMNSPNLGPYGDAIMQELIPYIEENFRIIRKPYARMLSGGSTGGWISLALQIFYPDFFGGTFSLCPDAVDFRAQHLVNIYEDKNAYFTEYEWLWVERPVLRRPDARVLEMMKDENHYELAVGDKCRSGGQWEIYMACYGPAGENGYPKELWNKLTGEIGPEVAAYWKEHFDLRYYLEKNWSWLGPKLKGKLHIYVGDMDSYYLNIAVGHLEDFLESTKDPYYEGVVEYGDGEPHCWGPGTPDLLKLMAAHVEKMKTASSMK